MHKKIFSTLTSIAFFTLGLVVAAPVQANHSQSATITALSPIAAANGKVYANSGQEVRLEAQYEISGHSRLIRRKFFEWRCYALNGDLFFSKNSENIRDFEHAVEFNLPQSLPAGTHTCSMSAYLVDSATQQKDQTTKASDVVEIVVQQSSSSASQLTNNTQTSKSSSASSAATANSTAANSGDSSSATESAAASVSAEEAAAQPEDNNSSLLIAIALSAAVIILLVSLSLIMWFNRSRNKQKGQATKTLVAVIVFAGFFALSLPSAAHAAGDFPAYRFYNTSNGTHFYTISTKERNKLLTTPSLSFYSYEGPRFYTNQQSETGALPAFRFYNTRNGTHFYTVSTKERDKIINSPALTHYNYEGINMYVNDGTAPGSVPMYRFYNTLNGSHFFTNSLSERNKLLNNSAFSHFAYEGIRFYVWGEPAMTNGTVLMFIAQEDAYYSEYKIMYEGLRASGYNVDVRSATGGTAGVYSLSGDIVANSNTPEGADYADFTAQFLENFGQPWNASWNNTPTTVPVAGSILDVADMSSYVGLVMPGGTGAQAYRYDGAYAAQGAISGATVGQVATKLNALAVEALSAGKPVMALCHGASLAAFFRDPDTFGGGADGLGTSLLAGQPATGYPEAATATTLSNLGVTNYRANDKVTIASPSGNFDNGNGDAKLMTTRDWYSQSVAYAARTFLNVLETMPAKAELEQNHSVLVLHGGPVDEGNCSPANTANDVPCNYGVGGGDTPADYTHLVALLNADSAQDNYSFTVAEANITTTVVDSTVLNNYDTVIFFKHWSTSVSASLQNALKQYADNGGGLIALHHGLYNQDAGGLNKDILVNDVFGAQSVLAGFVLPALHNYTLYSTNYGHFISTYGVTLNAGNLSVVAPAAWNGAAIPNGANRNYSYMQNFGIYDELYYNLAFVGGQSFGRGVGQITPLLSNAYTGTPSAQYHTSGFTKLYNPTGDASVGRVVYMQPGERTTSFEVTHRYAQMVRNAVVWSALAE